MQGGGEKEKSNAEKAHPRPAACLGVTLLPGSPLIYTFAVGHEKPLVTTRQSKETLDSSFFLTDPNLLKKCKNPMVITDLR